MSEEREKGFIVIQRRIQSWPLWKSMSGEQRTVILQLLLAARWQPDPGIEWRGKYRFQVNRGEVLTSERELAEACNASRKVVRTALDLLIRDGFITRERGPESGRRPSLISVVNYDRYQSVTADGDHEGAQARPARGPHEARYIREPRDQQGEPDFSLVVQEDDSPREGPYERVVEVWNRICVPAGFSRTRATPQARKACKTRCREPGWFEAFEAACNYIASEPFYRGGSSSGWVATLGWLLKPGNSEKTAERAGTVKGESSVRQVSAPAAPHRTETKRIQL